MAKPKQFVLFTVVTLFAIAALAALAPQVWNAMRSRTESPSRIEAAIPAMKRAAERPAPQPSVTKETTPAQQATATATDNSAAAASTTEHSAAVNSAAVNSAAVRRESNSTEEAITEPRQRTVRTVHTERASDDGSAANVPLVIKQTGADKAVRGNSGWLPKESDNHVMARAVGESSIALEEPVADLDLPESPSREEVGAVMSEFRPRMQDCYDRGMVPGEVTLLLTVAGSTGRVVNAEVSSESSTSTCVKQAAGELTFPKFAQAQATIRYPYIFE